MDPDPGGQKKADPADPDPDPQHCFKHKSVEKIESKPERKFFINDDLYNKEKNMKYSQVFRDVISIKNELSAG
jgi:hypothetical protein